MDDRFILVGLQPLPESPEERRPGWYAGKPLVSVCLLGLIVLGCLLCPTPRDPTFMDLAACDVPPGREFWFGTDAMGRDIFSMIWYGGRLSLLIGVLATAVSTGIAVLLGAAAGLGPRWLDGLLMRLTELLLSVPELLWVLLLRALLGASAPAGLALVIGLTGWMSLAKVVRTEVHRLRACEYVLAGRCMGGGFLHLLRKHLTPNLIPSMMFMVVMNLRGAITAEATLSFLGLGLPLEVISWGSLLSLSQRAMLSGAWWSVLIPGAFLVATLLCVTGIGNALRKTANRQESNL